MSCCITDGAPTTLFWSKEGRARCGNTCISKPDRKKRESLRNRRKSKGFVQKTKAGTMSDRRTCGKNDAFGKKQNGTRAAFHSQLKNQPDDWLVLQPFLTILRNGRSGSTGRGGLFGGSLFRLWQAGRCRCENFLTSVSPSASKSGILKKMADRSYVFGIVQSRTRVAIQNLPCSTERSFSRQCPSEKKEGSFRLPKKAVRRRTENSLDSLRKTWCFPSCNTG